MVNKNKIKGSQWERDATELLNTWFPGTWRRIPMSGALGTSLNIRDLDGDLQGRYWFLHKPIVAEAKVGYGGAHMKIEKEWFDGIAEVADKNYYMPIVLLKFEKARSGVRHIVAMDFSVWDEIMTTMEELKKEVDKCNGEEPT